MYNNSKFYEIQVDDEYYALFACEMGPSAAYSHYQKLNKDRFSRLSVKSDASINPDLDHINWLHRKFKGWNWPADCQGQLKVHF